MKRGLFVGRFQPFHNAHLQDVKDALKEVDELVIAIGSSQEHDTLENPFTVPERMEMISLALKSENIDRYVLFSIPDFNDDEKWVRYIEHETPRFEKVYTGNDWTERCFKKFNYPVHKITLIEGISSTIIREKIQKGEEWKHLVPKDVAEYIEYKNGTERITSLSSS